MHEFKNATNIRSLIPEVAKENNIDEKMLKLVVETYYGNLNKQIVAAEKPVILLYRFGRLKASKPKVEFTISLIEKFLKKPEEDSINYLIQKKYFNHSRLVKLQKTLSNINAYLDIYGKYKKNLEDESSNS
jgi:hypothetical protein